MANKTGAFVQLATLQPAVTKHGTAYLRGTLQLNGSQSLQVYLFPTTAPDGSQTYTVQALRDESGWIDLTLDDDYEHPF